MDLFEYMREQKKETESPLASRLRPTTLDEMVGQQHIIGKDKLLYRAIKADQLHHPLWTSGNRKDNACEGYCQFHKRRIFTDECNFCWEERHGRCHC